MAAPTVPLSAISAAGSTRKTKQAKSRYDGLPLTLFITALVVINVAGASYYLAPTATQKRHPWHDFLKPSGEIGQTAGILAFLIFAFLWLYPLRKKVRALAWTGAIGRWLDIHVTTALGLPLLLTVHAAWRADGVIGLGLMAMLVVCASGIIGRYLYVRIPRAKSGVELTREEVVAERDLTVAELSAALDEPADAIRRLIEPAEREAVNSVWGVLRGLMLDDLHRMRRRRELTARWSSRRGVSKAVIHRAVKLASREMALADQLRMLEATQKVFRYWHIAHMPFALTALIAVTVHVVVVIVMGATWFW